MTTTFTDDDGEEWMLVKSSDIALVEKNISELKDRIEGLRSNMRVAELRGRSVLHVSIIKTFLGED